MSPDEAEDRGLTWVGRPMELVRAVDPVYLDEARRDFDDYLHETLSASQRVGGRFNPPCEFGALYTASDEDTAWEEIAVRYAREGVEGLPSKMGMIGLLVLSGKFVDFTRNDVAGMWSVDPGVLASAVPSDAEQQACWDIGRAARAVADFLRSRSARADGTNVPLFPDRENSELEYDVQYFADREPPEHLRQAPNEEW